jgi:ectoine hydroxylase-related dioxygenase (phytanoyl-CoA dioxygenase family)
MSHLDQQLDTYHEQGYLVVPEALTPDEVDAVNAAIDGDLEADTPFWIEREDGHVRLNVHMLLAHEEMDVTMRPPSLLPILQGILGQDLCAEEHSVRIRRPFTGQPYCHWHRDCGGWPQLGDPPGSDTHYVSVAYYLSDVDGTTHTLSVLPGSASREQGLPPLDHYDLATAHHIEGAKGTAVVFNAGMFHAGNVRRSQVERRTIHIYCGRPTAPPISNYTIFPRRLWDHEDDVIRRYYGKANPITKLLQECF